MDVLGGGTSCGTTIDGYHCNGTPAQVWTIAFVSATGTLVTFINPQSNKCLDSMAGTNNAAMKLTACSSSSASQRFQLTSAAVTALKAVSAGSVPLWTVPVVTSPPPPSPALSTARPPPPSPAPGAGPTMQPPASQPAYVSATLSLSGYSVSTFGTAEATQFKAAVAATLGATANAVTITSVTAPSGRHLLQSSVNIGFTLATTYGSQDSVSSKILYSMTSQAFQLAGLHACSSVGVIGYVSNGASALAAAADVTSTLPATTATANVCNSATGVCSACTCDAAATCGQTYCAAQALSFQNAYCTTGYGYAVVYPGGCAAPSSSQIIKPAACLIAAAAALATLV